MEKIILLILGVLLAIVAAVVHWGPVSSYLIECERATEVTCTLERSKASGTQSSNIHLGPGAFAKVHVVQQRRTADNIYLYIHSAEQTLFVAQFETLDPVGDAEAAAAQLNQVLHSSSPVKTRIEVQPAGYFRWLSWGGLGFTAVLLVATYLELRRRDKHPNN